jgi:hypothetical protein
MHRIEGTNFTKNSSRQNIFKDSPPATTVPAQWLNAVQQEICNVIERAGGSVLSAATDTFDQLWQAISQATTSFSYIVSSQATFNSLFERVGANQYKIKDMYTSVYIKYISGGYACYGGNSFLSGGDTWGYIYTNNCKLLLCEGDAYFQFGSTQGYFNFNTLNFIGYNIDIRGLGIAPAATNYSFYLNSNGIKLINPKTSLRKSNTNFTAFYSNVTDNNQFILNPVIGTIDTNGGTIKAFYQCYNIQNPYITSLNSSSGIETIFDACKRINNFLILSCINTTEHIYTFKDCYNIGVGEVNTIQHTGAVAAKNVIVFNTCTGIDDRNLIITSVSTNGAGGIAPIYSNCTFRSTKISQIVKATNYVITANDDFDEMLINCNTASQYGTINISLCLGSQTNGDKKSYIHGANKGLIKIICQGADKILYKGNELTYIYLYQKGDKITLYFDGVYWQIKDPCIIFDTGFYNNSDQTSMSLPSIVFLYDTKNAAVSFEGMVLTEETSGNTFVVLEDTGGIGNSGTFKCYLATGTGIATNNKTLTASDGHTALVNEVSGSNKNKVDRIYHNFGVNAYFYDKETWYSLDLTEDDTYPMICNSDFQSGQAYGQWYSHYDTNSLLFNTDFNGMAFINKSFAASNLSANDVYFRHILKF